MKRSESAKTTLSMYATKAGKYQKWLGMVNVLLLLSALVLLFFGVILKINYFMDQLGLISRYFEVLPVSLIALGVILFIVSALGFIFAGVESRPALFGYSVTMVIIVLFQISTIFFIMESRSLIQNGNIFKVAPDAIEEYYQYPDSAFRRDWDVIQLRLRCCGFASYTDHLNKNSMNKVSCVPDSCCRKVTENGNCSQIGEISGDCPRLRGQSAKGGSAYDVIFSQGCYEVLESVYERELKVQLLMFGLFDVLVILLEVVSCALAAAYVAQITRRQKNYYWNEPGAGHALRGEQTMQMSRVGDADQ